MPEDLKDSLDMEFDYKTHLENNLGVNGIVNNGDSSPDDVENLETKSLEYLKCVAASICIEFYDSLDITEINKMSGMEKMAWEVGRALRAYRKDDEIEDDMSEVILTAENAKKITKDSIERSISNKLKAISKHIMEESQKGGCNIRFNLGPEVEVMEKVIQKVIGELKISGYNVKKCTENLMSVLYIDWN